MDKIDISKIIKVLKDDHRSYVCVFKVDGDNKEYVYKKPREKNTRKWQKFLHVYNRCKEKRKKLYMSM